MKIFQATAIRLGDDLSGAGTFRNREAVEKTRRKSFVLKKLPFSQVPAAFGFIPGGRCGE
ncbi:hypothetical protein [Thermogutta sp.]|uniref:hypothetical protein n=1 Tax=Thermogutta sp. TaxID=1962930 RepID=UPI00321FC88D